MNARILLIPCLACLAALASCIAEQKPWQGFQGTPAHGLQKYVADLRVSDIRDNTELRSGRLFVSGDRLRYEMQESGPLENAVLLAGLDSGQAWIVNPRNNACLEGNFTPRRWMDIEYLLGAFPKIAHAEIISSKEEALGTETVSGYKARKIRRTGREILFGEERDFTDFFWLAEASSIPLRHENGMIRTELTNIHKKAAADSHFTLPAACRKVSSLAELLK